jgi:hypothetical protein
MEAFGVFPTSKATFLVSNKAVQIEIPNSQVIYEARRGENGHVSYSFRSKQGGEPSEMTATAFHTLAEKNGRTELTALAKHFYLNALFAQPPRNIQPTYTEQPSSTISSAPPPSAIVAPVASQPTAVQHGQSAKPANPTKLVATDGKCAIVGYIDDPKNGKLYDKETDPKKARVATLPLGSKIHGYHGGIDSSSLKNDPKLVSSLPTSVLSQLADDMKSGAVLVSHVSHVTGCSAGGSKPSSPGTPTRR